MKYTSRIYLSLVFAVLYIPILTLILFSFNAENSTAEFAGFDFRWYIELFNSPETFTALRNTLILAVLSALLATVIGTAAAEGIYRMRSKLLKGAINSVTNIPMMNPDIVTGMSMMLFFAAALGILKLIYSGLDYNDIGFVAMLISHTTFCLPYVILSVLPRINELGDTLSEAALDLGCTPFRAFFKVKLPNIMPAVLSGMVMAFTLSLDDFVISYFVGPSNFQTLPLLIYSMTKKKVTPDMYALSTIVIVTVFVLLIISNFKSDKKSGINMKKRKIATVAALSVAAALIVTVITVSLVRPSDDGTGAPPSETITINVYNWGEYISDGFEGTLDTNAAFEEYYYEKYGVRVKVNYTTYATNEDMYSKLKNGAVIYDIVVPSDYMIEKMIAEDMLLSFDVAADIPNYQYIESGFRNPYYDEGARYSVPYTYGMIGLIYNKAEVDAADAAAKSWGLLWNEKYAGKILQFNNPRDAFATAMYWKGLDVNSEDPAVWDEALGWLETQKPILQGYVNDEIFNKMTTESAAIAPYYVGDFLIMAEQEPNLDFYYPTEGANYFVDAMCIPKNAKYPEIAKEYINFMLSEEAAVANAVYIGYASPNTLVQNSEEYREEMSYYDYAPDEDGNMTRSAYDLLYGMKPDVVNAGYNALVGDKNAACYRNFTPEIQARVNTLWENLKISGSTELWVHISCFVIVGAVLSLGVYSVYTKKKRSRNYRLRDKNLAKARKANMN